MVYPNCFGTFMERKCNNELCFCRFDCAEAEQILLKIKYEKKESGL